MKTSVAIIILITLVFVFLACKGSKQTVVVGYSKTKSKPKPISNNKQSKITSKVTPPSSKNAEVIKIKGASKGAEVNSKWVMSELFL